MPDYNRPNSSNLDAVTSVGVVTLANRDGAPSTFGVTLAANTTYYFVVGNAKAPVCAETPVIAAHFKSTSAGLIATITFEDCVFPPTRGAADGTGDPDVTDFSQVVGDWIPENPSTAIVSFVGTGWTSSAMTVTVAGTGVGGATFHLGNFAARRGRFKVVTGAAGGLLRCGIHGKSAA